MNELNIPDKLKKSLSDFIHKLKQIYTEDLISVVLYGSAASGEFVDRHSNLNLLVVLKSADLENLKKATYLINKFSILSPLFLTQDYIASSTDIFPIEFLDMRENYLVLYGKDVLGGINIDIRNLRFQCEQELKVKLINLRQLYLKVNKDKTALRNLFFKSFNSILHILRNVLRLKNKTPAYKKEEILKQLALEFNIDMNIWGKILAAKAKKIKLNNKDAEQLFIDFIRELERIITVVDKL